MSSPEPQPPNAPRAASPGSPDPGPPPLPPAYTPVPPANEPDEDEIAVAAYIAQVARRNVIWPAISGLLLGYMSLFSERAEHPQIQFALLYARLAFPLLVIAAFLMMVGKKWVLVMAFLIAAIGTVGWIGLGAYLLAAKLDTGGGWGLILLGGWWLYWAQLNGRVLRQLREYE
jgi:hypothetical protein